MSALNTLQQKNGLKTTQSVLNKQQSGVDAAQKANPQQSAQQMNMNTAKAMMQGKQNTLTPPKDAHEQAVRTNQQTAEAMMHSQTSAVEADKQESTQPEQPKRMSYADMFKAINKDEEETPEQKEKREKRERRNATIAAIGDGLRALSNMYFATKGAKVVHDPNSDLSAVQLKRKQMIDAQREKNKSAWLTGYQKALALDEEARKNDATLEENKRWHDLLKEKYDRSGDQTDTRLKQNEQRIQLTADKLNEAVRHNKETESTASKRVAVSAAKATKAGNGRRATATTRAQQQWCMDKVVEFANRSPKNAEIVLKAIASVGGKQLTLNTASGVYNIINGYGNKPSSGGGKGKTPSKGGGKKGSWASGLKF